MKGYYCLSSYLYGFWGPIGCFLKADPSLLGDRGTILVSYHALLK